MVCLYCRKPVGFVRRIKDPNFCSDEHRQKLVSRSARALRDAEDLYGPEAGWSARRQSPEKTANESRPGHATTVFAVAAIAFLLIAVSDLPVTSSSYISPLPSNSKAAPKEGLGTTIGNLVSIHSGSARDDFRSGLTNWEGIGRSSADWILEDTGYVRPGNLRLWKKSTSLSNYEFEFMGRIERKSVDWAFRATDAHNYYATKLTISRPGVLPNAGLVRFIVMDGRERERVELPLPLTLERGVDYRVHLSVRGNRFLTSVNNQLVSSWTDNRLTRGGVGFFSEDGESALLKWASVSERDSLLGRIASHFSLISFPAAELTQLP